MAVRSVPLSSYRWSPAANWYINARGQFVSPGVIRAEIDHALEAATARARTLAESLKAGEITVEEWELAMRELSKDVHLYNAAAARGGWANLSADDFGRVGRIVRDEYAYLRNFRHDLERGTPMDGRFLARTRLYAQAGRETFHKVERQGQLEQGKTVERSILGAADHCDLCVSEAARGWVLIGQLIPIGQRTCGRNCKCTIEYSSVNELADNANAGKTDPEPSLDEPPGPYRAKYAMALMDMDTCDHCAQFDGVVVELTDPRQLPDHACTSKRGCHCTWIYIRKDESKPIR
jgi:hypothetical protein